MILLIISSDFLNSSYCYDLEMKRALERHEENSCVIIPIIARSCDWTHCPFSKIQAVPKDARPISKWADRDDAFLDIAQKLRSVLGTPEARPIVTAAALKHRSEPPRTEPRSSNLRVKKVFTDREISRFLVEGFEYVERFFRNSLEELQNRIPSIETDCRKIDANTFTAQIFRNGKAVASCKIFLGNKGATGTGKI